MQLTLYVIYKVTVGLYRDTVPESTKWRSITVHVNEIETLRTELPQNPLALTAQEMGRLVSTK